MTSSLAAVYAPIGLMGVLTGALFREFAFTLAGSVIVSGVIALTLSPMMSSWLLSAKVSAGRFAQTVEHRMERLAQGYYRLIQTTLAARPAVPLFGVAVLFAIEIMFNGARRELAPQVDQGYETGRASC